MPTRPSVAPDFATDANYPAGSDPWSGNPTKVTPGAVASTGFIPKTMLPAQFINYVLANHADWINYLDQIRGSVTQFEDYDRDYEDFAFGDDTDDPITVTSPGLLASGLTRFYDTVGNTKLVFSTAGYDPPSSRGVVHFKTADGFGIAPKLRGAIRTIGASDPFALLCAVRCTTDRTKLDTNANGGIRVQLSSNPAFNCGSTRTYWEPIDSGGTIQTPLVNVPVTVGGDWDQLRMVRTGGTLYWYVNGTLIYSEASVATLALQRNIFVRGILGVGADYEYACADYIKIHAPVPVL